MADGTAIEWTDATWNPIRGCSRVSPGCGGANHEGGCYAEKVAARFSDPGQPYHGFAERTKYGGRWTSKLALIESQLTLPLRWKKPRRIFVNSMSDLFHEGLPDEEIDSVFAVMALCPQHTFQVLTKRAERMRGYLSMARAHPVGLEALGITLAAHAANPRSTVGAGCILQGDIAHLKAWPLPNVWAGVSAEDQQRADERIPHLLNTPAAVRFLSCEPLLGPVNLRNVSQHTPDVHAFDVLWKEGADLGLRPRIDWVITGGESGPNARPSHPEWFRSLRDQCEAAGVAYFHKQNGEWIDADAWLDSLTGTIMHNGASWTPARPLNFSDAAIVAEATGRKDRLHHNSDGTTMIRVGKKAAGATLDGREWREFPT